MLERKIGDVSAAIAALTRNLHQMDDPRTLAILTALCATADRPEQTRTWADRLRSACAQTDAAPGVDLMLRSLGLPGFDAADAPNENLVQILATELLANEDVIPSLAAAQQLQPDIGSARLLVAALEQSLDDLETPAVGFEALARLCEVLDDREAAIDWIRRGIELCPMSAGLARLSRELCDTSNSRETEDAGLECAA
jgi:hypothetical protein